MLCIGMLLLLVGSTFMARFLAGMECGELSFVQGDMLNTGAELYFLSGEMPSLKLFK